VVVFGLGRASASTPSHAPALGAPKIIGVDLLNPRRKALAREIRLDPFRDITEEVEGICRAAGGAHRRRRGCYSFEWSAT